MDLKPVITPKLYEQVLYVPDHLMKRKSLLGYPNGCQAGYISLIVDDRVFCRFWLWNPEEEDFADELRTKANAEMVNLKNLFYYPCKAQAFVIRTQESLLLPERMLPDDILYKLFERSTNG